MNVQSRSKYLLITILSLISLSFLCVILNKTFGLDPHFLDKEEKDDASSYKFRLPGVVISYVNRLYVDPERIDTKEMIKEAFSWEERIIPEVLTDFSEETNIQTITVEDVSKTYDLSKIKRPKDVFRTLQDGLAFINMHREPHESVTVNDLEYTAINGMLTQLDPHSVILPPKVFDEFKIGTTGKFGGLGMVVGMREGMLTVISPIEGTPASRAGMKAGDKITEVDGESTINLDLTEAVGKLRGDPGTSVTLSVLSAEATQSRLVRMKREIIVIPTVESASLGNGLGYIKIRNFQDDTSQSLNEQLKQLKTDMGTIKGLVIDLRNNSGGLLDQAIKVSDKFLENGAIVVTVGPGGHPTEVVGAQKTNTDEEFYPIVVLVDAGSASGAEIVAGALKENNRAVIIGDRSFGKGSVQQLLELMDGSALKLTIAKYLTPLYTDIQSFGITPDIQLIPVTVGKDDINLFRGITAIREEDLKKHLDDHHKEAKPFATLKYFQEINETENNDEEAEEKEGMEGLAEDIGDPYKLPDFDTDFHVIFAKKILMNATTWEREALLKETLPVIEEITKPEEDKIAQALKGLDIDWSTGVSAGTATISASFSTNPPSKTVEAGGEIVVMVTVKNTGEFPLYRLRGISSSKNGLFNKHEFPLGKIEKGETKSYSKSIKIPKNSLDREDVFTIAFEELNNNKPEDLVFNITTKALPRPLFAYSYQILDKRNESSGCNNGDGLIQKGEDIELLITVKNTGEGSAEKSVINLRNLSDKKDIYVKNGRAEVGSLNPGEIKKAKLSFQVKEAMKEKEFSMDLIIAESTFGTFLSHKLTFPVGIETPQVVKTPGILKITRNHTPLYGGMSFDSPVLSMLGEGTHLISEAQSPAWFRVMLPNDGYGWVSAKDVLEVNDLGDNTPETLEPYIQRIPPKITLDASSANELFVNDCLALSAIVEDDTHVKHAYVLINNDKVFFKSNKIAIPREQSRLKIATELPLKEGPNIVTIVARDDHDLTTVKSFVATRLPVAEGTREL